MEYGNLFDIIKPLEEPKNPQIAMVINNINNKTHYNRAIMERMKLTP